MTRDEFLNELRIALQGRISQAQVNEQLRYYETYIIEESRKGKTEKEVLLLLGNPRLIAKTIIEVCGNGTSSQTQEKEAQNRKREPFHFKGFRLYSWFSRACAALILILFLILLVRIGILLLPILASAFMAGVILYYIFRIFFGNKK